MPAILIALVVIVCVVLAFLNFMPFTNKQVQATEPPEKKDQQATEQQKTPILTRLELENRLKKLAESEPPKELFMGAMCYDMAAPPARVEYVCPDCGEKTFYVQDYENKVKPKKGERSGHIKNVQNNVPKCRRLIKTLTGVDAEIIEKEFCDSCSPDIDNPTLKLVIHYPNGKTHKAENINVEDLILIKEFLNGETAHKDFYDAQTPLKQYIKRLETLLGIKIALPEPPK